MSEEARAAAWRVTHYPDGTVLIEIVEDAGW